jgi:arylsulfatase
MPKRTRFSRGSAVGLATLIGCIGMGARSSADKPSGDPAPPGLAIPAPDPHFQGIAQRTLAGSKPDYPAPIQAPSGAPNIVVILIDDAGFGNPSTFGGPVQTATLERLAKQGLRYNAFHVTALCSPTRAALLSGRNHHAVGFGSISEIASGWPGYNARWPKSAASIAEILRSHGYSTAAFGKWHLTPDDQQSAAGPFDRWPNALGFDYFWGFLGGENSQWDPLLVENNTIIGVPKQKNYYFPVDMADHAIRWLREQQSAAPDRPFFIYFATGATHAPHHVPKEWADKYKGRFDIGWDKLREQTFDRQKQLGVIPPNAKLTPRPAALPAWDTLSSEVKKLYARQMEVYAGYQENADYQVGRVIQAIEQIGIADNTLILYIFGDNGASLEGTETGCFNELVTLNGIKLTPDQQLKAIKEYGGIDKWGGPRTDPHYAAAWAWAGNTPFQWGKQVASHLGGIRDPMVISWPRRIKDKGGLRSQFTHVIDVAPTLLELAGIPAPSSVNGIVQVPMHGVSFAYSFDDARAPSRHAQQYFEILGNRALYKDGWLYSCRLDRVPWVLDPKTMARFAPDVWNPDKDRCELYHLEDDYSQADDLAAKYPDKLKELRDLFWKDAVRYQVTPLLGGMASAWGFKQPSTRTHFVFYPSVENIAPGMIPPIYGRSYTISADLEVPAGGSKGVIVANASFLGGFSLYVNRNRLTYTYSLLGLKIDDLTASENMPIGKVSVRYEFVADHPGELGTGGTGRLFINGKQVGQNHMEHTVPGRFSGYAGMDIGRDNGLPVSPHPSYAWRAPFAFDGTIERVEFELK